MGFIQLKLPKRIKHKIENSKRNRDALAEHKKWLDSQGLDEKTLKKRLKNFKGFDIPKYEPDPNQPKCKIEGGFEIANKSCFHSQKAHTSQSNRHVRTPRK